MRGWAIMPLLGIRLTKRVKPARLRHRVRGAAKSAQNHRHVYRPARSGASVQAINRRPASWAYSGSSNGQPAARHQQRQESALCNTMWWPTRQPGKIQPLRIGHCFQNSAPKLSRGQIGRYAAQRQFGRTAQSCRVRDTPITPP